MSMRDYTYIMTAGETISRNVGGNYFHVLEAVGKINIKFDDGVYISRERGQGGSRDYERVDILSPIDQTISLALGYGVEFDGRQNSSTAGTGGAAIDVIVVNNNFIRGGALRTVSPAAGAVLLAAADGDRRQIRISVRSNNADGIYIGESDMSTATGTYGGFIESGGVDYIDTTAAIYALNDGGSDVIVNVLEIGLT